MDSVARYKYHEARFNDSVAKFRDAEAVDLREELALARALCNEIADCTSEHRQARLPALRDCLKVIASLTAAESDRRLRNNELLSRTALERYSTAVCRIVCEELQQSSLQDWEDVADKIAARLGECTAP